MEMNINKVKGLMAENNLKQQDLAEVLNLSLRTINLKLNFKVAFKLKEVEKLASYFNKDIGYFFTKDVQNKCTNRNNNA